MSIINSNRHQARIMFHLSVPRRPEPSKAELAEDLARAAANTAAMQDVDARVACDETRSALSPGHDHAK